MSYLQNKYRVSALYPAILPLPIQDGVDRDFDEFCINYFVGKEVGVGKLVSHIPPEYLELAHSILMHPSIYVTPISDLIFNSPTEWIPMIFNKLKDVILDQKLQLLIPPKRFTKLAYHATVNDPLLLPIWHCYDFRKLDGLRHLLSQLKRNYVKNKCGAYVDCIYQYKYE